MFNTYAVNLSSLNAQERIAMNDAVAGSGILS